MGMTDDDMTKPQIGVASSWNEVTPCNMPLDRLAKRAKVAVRDGGAIPFEFRHHRRLGRDLHGSRRQCTPRSCRAKLSSRTR